MNTTKQTDVGLYKEIKETQVKRTKKAFIFFNVEWWETVSTNELGNDIHIETENKIRNVYLNGSKIK